MSKEPFHFHNVRWPQDPSVVAALWHGHSDTVPPQHENHNCFEELSEVSPGLYLGPQAAVSHIGQMLPLGICLLLRMNASENQYEVCEEVNAQEFDIRITTKGPFVSELKEYVTRHAEAIKAEGIEGDNIYLPRKIFILSVAADDNQFFNLSTYFTETVSLMEIVLDARRALEGHGLSTASRLKAVAVPINEDGSPASSSLWRPRHAKEPFSASICPITSKRISTTLTTHLESCAHPPPSVAVHCLVGMSRSATIVMAYLMKYLRLPYQTIFSELVKVRRPIAEPNSGFVSQLHSWEACGYVTAGGVDDCEAAVSGIQGIRLLPDGSLVATTAPANQLVAIKSLLGVYLRGNRYKAERLNIGRVLWPLVTSEHATLALSDILALIASMAFAIVADGVYEDCPAIFLGIYQVLQGLSQHADTAELLAAVKVVATFDADTFTKSIVFGVGSVEGALDREGFQDVDASLQLRDVLHELWKSFPMPAADEGLLALLGLFFCIIAVASKAPKEDIANMVLTFEKGKRYDCFELVPLVRYLTALLQ